MLEITSLGKGELQELFLPQNTQLTEKKFVAVAELIRANKHPNIFELSDVRRTDENVLTLLANYAHTRLDAIVPSAFNANMSPTLLEFSGFNPGMIRIIEADLLTLIEGNHDPLTAIDNDVSSLSRHLMRVPSLAKIYMTLCLKYLGINMSDAKMLEKFAHDELGGMHPFHIGVLGYFHDYIRHFTQSSKHDNFIAILSQKMGINPIIPDSVYKIQPIERLIDNPETWDNGAQKVLRIADLLGKRKQVGENRYKYFTSIDEVCERAATNQRRYFEQEQSVEGSLWHKKKDEAYFINYIKNERILLESAVSWFEKMGGVRLSELMTDLNENPDNYELAD